MNMERRNFVIGESVIYYPVPDDHREHHLSTVVGLTPKRVRIQIDGGNKVVLCSAERLLAGQIELPAIAEATNEN